MASLKEICTFLSDLLQADLFEDAAANGLQIEGSSEVHTIRTAVTASLAVIEQAVQEKASLLLVHHGLFWQKESPLVVGLKGEKIKKLVKGQVSLIAYHLPLDAHPDVGNNFKAAIDLGLKNLAPFQKIGVIGEWGEAQSIEKAEEKIESYYGQKARSLFSGPKAIKRVAILSGAGWRELSAAKRVGADLFITGSVDEPVYHAAKEEAIHFMGVGHAASEKIGPRALGERIAQKFNLPHRFLDEENPF